MILSTLFMCTNLMFSYCEKEYMFCRLFDNMYVGYRVVDYECFEYAVLTLLMYFLGCSEQDARMKIYSVSTRHYFAFGALVSEELSYKLKGNCSF